VRAPTLRIDADAGAAGAQSVLGAQPASTMVSFASLARTFVLFVTRRLRFHTDYLSRPRRKYLTSESRGKNNCFRHSLELIKKERAPGGKHTRERLCWAFISILCAWQTVPREAQQPPFNAAALMNFALDLQYGFVNYALELLVVKTFGEETWEKIK
jgi:hypothetical protein